MKRINWLVVFPTMFFVGLVYLLFAPELLKGREIDHLMLATSGLMWGLLCAGLATVTQWDGLNRQKGGWRTALSILNAIALGVAFLGVVAGTTGAGLSEIAPDVFARHQTMHTIALLASAYFIATLLTVRNRFEVAEETIVILDGKVLYPGTRFTLWPWFRYRARTVNRWIEIPSTVMNLNFSDGTFAVEVRDVVVGLAIAVAEESGVTSLNYDKFFGDGKQWVRESICDQVKSRTLGAFLRRGQMPRATAKIHGVLISWDGEAEIRLV